MNFLKVLIPSMPFFILLWIDHNTGNTSMTNNIRNKNDEETSIKVAIVEEHNKAYWIVNNVLYEANLVNGMIDREDAKPVDAFGINYKEVTKILRVLDNIQDWKN